MYTAVARRPASLRTAQTRQQTLPLRHAPDSASWPSGRAVPRECRWGWARKEKEMPSEWPMMMELKLVVADGAAPAVLEVLVELELPHSCFPAPPLSEAT